MQTNILLWTMGKKRCVYPHGKCWKHWFSTKLFTLSTAAHREKCHTEENRCVFCGNLKSLKNRHSSFWEKMWKTNKLCYGNQKWKNTQIFLLVLTEKKVWIFEKICKRKKGFWKRRRILTVTDRENAPYHLNLNRHCRFWYIFRSLQKDEDHEGSCFYAL